MYFQKWQKMAGSAGITHILAESTNAVNGLHRLLTGSQHLTAAESICHEADWSVIFRLGSNPKTAFYALSAKLRPESHKASRMAITSPGHQTHCEP